MKTIEEIKNEVAQRHGFDAWDLYEFDRQNGCKINILIDECIQEHAKQVAEAQRSSDAENIKSNMKNISYSAIACNLVKKNFLVTDTI